MRKRIVPVGQVPQPDGDWLDLGSLAEVEISSEVPEHPIESALISGNESGWRAGNPGRQQISLIFSPPHER
jgi:hypothetical protein